MAVADLSAVLKSARFRQLLSVRLTGQICDGLLQAALATFVLFSPERQASAQAIVTAFAILYLPYSLIGPFAGVLLDRWSRRQVLLYGNLVRAAVIVGVCMLTAAGRSGLDLGIAVLIALGINRFILAGLSAALPHTVPRETLVTANALAPTAGTLFAALGGLLGIGIRAALGGGDAGSTAVLVVAAAGCVVAGSLAILMPRDSLGPDGDVPRDSLMAFVKGFGDGAVTLWRARPAFRAVTVVVMHRVAFGAVTVLVILLLRNTLNPPTDPEAALTQLGLVIGGAAGGALAGAVVTPKLTRVLGPTRWSVITLMVSGLVTPAAVAVANLPALIIGGVAVGLAGQSVKICGDTAVQQQIADDHRGRVFALYDVVLNVGLVAGVAAVAYTSPESGRSVADLIGIAAILIGTALWHLIRWRQDSTAPRTAP